MSENRNETLYEKTMRQLKNNPIVVAILVLGAIGVGISQGLDIFTRIRETVAPPQPQIPQITEIQLTIQPYDVVTGYQGSPILRTLEVEQGTEIAAIAGSMVEQITEAIRPGSGSDYRANLEIKEGILTSDKDLAGEAIVMNSFEQVPARVEIRDLARGSDLTRLFADPSTFDADCSCIHLELQVPADGYQNAALEIYQVGDGYSFDPSSPQAGKTLEFPVVPVSVLVEAPTGTGSDETTLGDTAARLNNSLRQQVNDSASLELSPYQSVSELRAVIDPLIPSIPPGGGKGDVLGQYNVDYVITTNFIMK